MKRIVIVGGGFGGIYCAKRLAKDGFDVTIVDRRNFHLFQPLLYQVATGGLSPGDIAAPLRTIVKDYKNVRVVLAEVTDIDPVAREVTARDAGGDVKLPYDALVVATGARHSYFGHNEWEKHAPGLKTIEDATMIRARVLYAFEAAERATDPVERAAWLRIIIVGGGPTGVELAGAIGELAQHTTVGEFRNFDPTRDAKVMLLEGADRILLAYAPHLSEYAVGALQALNVAVLLKTKVVDIDKSGVTIETAEGREELASHTVIWAAGVEGSPLAKVLSKRTGCMLDRQGRVIVEPDLTLRDHPNICVIGDLASFVPAGEKMPLPGVAPVAMQMGTHAAHTIARRFQQRPGTPFKYFDRGTMAVIGRAEAVARLGVVNWNLTGFVAWFMWLFIHLMFLVGFENKMLVMLQWANHYFTRHRGARLIGPADVGDHLDRERAQSNKAAVDKPSGAPNGPPNGATTDKPTAAA
jgi:NADH dehydrogenase